MEPALAGRYFPNTGRTLLGKGTAAAAGSLPKAVRYYSIASHPNLKHDELADQAQLAIGNMAGREAGRSVQVPLKELQVPPRA